MKKETREERKEEGLLREGANSPLHRLSACPTDRGERLAREREHAISRMCEVVKLSIIIVRDCAHKARTHQHASTPHTALNRTPDSHSDSESDSQEAGSHIPQSASGAPLT